jgi:radical SAM protein with 4Fe4S-binding SPASM domain
MDVKKNTNFTNMPEIYQIEVTSACNFNCVMCPRKNYKRDLNKFIDINLVKKIIKNDLDGSYFVELQMIGEPLLHPEIETIIDLLKSKVQVGLSTNGALIDKNLKAIEKLDYLTISVDSLKNYETIRVNGKLDKLIKNIDLVMNLSNKPKIDLQIIELNDWKTSFNDINKLIKEKKWDCVLRTIPDLCKIMRHEESKEKLVTNDLCLNPFASVSIHADGDVVPCCFAWGKEIVYGNLNENSLIEIWNSENVLNLKKQHQTQTNLPKMCQECYARSPMLLHFQILKNQYKK